MKDEFQECPTCAAKPGTPTLCESCLNNRRAISSLKEAIKWAVRSLNDISTMASIQARNAEDLSK